MNFVTSFGLLLLGLFVLPVLVSGCLPDGRAGVPWYEARRDPTGFAPDPATTPDRPRTPRPVARWPCARPRSPPVRSRWLPRRLAPGTEAAPPAPTAARPGHALPCRGKPGTRSCAAQRSGPTGPRPPSRLSAHYAFRAAPLTPPSFRVACGNHPSCHVFSGENGPRFRDGAIRLAASAADVIVADHDGRNHGHGGTRRNADSSQRNPGGERRNGYRGWRNPGGKLRNASVS